MSKQTYGTTASGKPIDDKMIEELSAEAERGYTEKEIGGKLRGRGRPPLGDAAKLVEAVRLDARMREDVAERAHRDGVTVSEVIRRAIDSYVHASSSPRRKSDRKRAHRRH